MLAQNNKYIEEASATVYQLSQEERIRMECEAREDYYRTQLGIQHMLDEQDATLKEQTAQLTAQAAQIEAQNAEIETKTAEIEAQAAEIETKIAEIKAQAAEIDRLRKWIEMHGHNPADI